MLRNVNVIAFAIAVAILFAFVGMPDRQSVTAQDDKPKAVEPALEPAIAEVCKCECDAKLADLQKQIDDLKAKVGELACKCEPKPAAPLPPAPQAKAPAATETPRKLLPKILPRQPQRCPGGNCPLQNVDTSGIQLNPGERLLKVDGVPVSKTGHWSFPGSVDTHLLTDHARELERLGVDISGMSAEQMMSLHDELHESRQLLAVNTRSFRPLFPNLRRK